MATLNTDLPIAGNPGNWPTAAAIDNRIAMSERGNGVSSPLHGLGSYFIQYGNKYGINPGFVCAILQRETQLGTDGSPLYKQCNNFGGNTWASSTGYPKCNVSGYDRPYNKYPTPQEGLEGVFKNLDRPIYRNTGGRLIDVMEVYAPSYENDMDEMRVIYGEVASNLGITLNDDTNIYTRGGTSNYTPLSNTLSSSPGGIIKDVSNWAISGLSEGLLRLVLVAVGIVALYAGGKAILNG